MNKQKLDVSSEGPSSRVIVAGIGENARAFILSV
jgi:hypothetical protein